MQEDLGRKISVCLLTYNHAYVIESTLRSALDQTLDGFEVVVSDDCSTDGTWEAVLRVAERDGRVRAIRTPRNLGMAGNANYAVGQCDRPYVALLHHDDLYREDLLEKWADVLERFPDVAFVFNPYAVHGSDTPGLLKPGGRHRQCEECHWELKDKHHLLSAEQLKKGMGGEEAEARGCLLCHLPHASESKRLMRPAASQVCIGCHKK